MARGLQTVVHFKVLNVSGSNYKYMTAGNFFINTNTRASVIGYGWLSCWEKRNDRITKS